MKLRLSLHLARKYLIAKWSLMSTLSILMIAFGVITLITVLSIMNGFHNTFRRKILETNTYHIIVQPFSGSPELQERTELIAQHQEVQAIIPHYDGEAIISSTEVTRGAILKALPEDVLKRDTGFGAEIRITEGTFDLEGKDRIVVGEELARDAGVEVGDFITILTLKKGDLTAKQPQFNLFKVTGFFKTGYWEYDKNMAYISLDSAYRIFGIGKQDLTLGLKLENLFRADRVARWITGYVPFHAVYTWMEINRPLFEALQNEKVGIGFVVMLIIVSGAFNIIGSLIMTVMDKRREIGILRALGARPGLITQVFVLDGLFIGLIGTMVGVFSGFILALNVESIFRFFEQVVNALKDAVYRLFFFPLGYTPFPEFELLSDSIYYLEGVPVDIHFVDVIVVSLLSLLLSVLAAYYPARKAAIMKPVETIRYE
jgi:lipoprotein-releasing system permease protein